MRDRYRRDAGELLKRSSMEILATTDFCRRRQIEIGFNEYVGLPNRYRSGELA